MCLNRFKQKYGLTNGDVLCLIWFCVFPCVPILVGFFFIAFPESFVTALQDDDGNLSIDLMADKIATCMGCISVLMGIIMAILVRLMLTGGKKRRHLGESADFDDADVLKERIDSLEYEVKLLRTAVLCNDETLADKGVKR